MKFETERTSGPEGSQDIETRLRELQRYKELETAIAEAQKSGRPFGKLQAELEDITERGAVTSSYDFWKDTLRDIPEVEIQVPGEYEDDSLRLKVLPDGKVLDYSGASIKVLDSMELKEQLSDAEREYQEKIDELQKNLDRIRSLADTL